MVRTYAGLTPAAVAADDAPPMKPAATETLAASTTLQTHRLDLSSMADEAHTVDTPLLIQDSHVHLLVYAIVAALEAVVVLGLDWPAWARDTVITAAFTSGLLYFAGQWLMKAGWPAFALLTIGAGWAMAIVYLAIVAGTYASPRSAGRAVPPGTGEGPMTRMRCPFVGAGRRSVLDRTPCARHTSRRAA